MRIQHDKNRITSPPEKLELFVAKSGMLSARINRKGTLFHIHSGVRPEDEAKYFEGTEFWGDLIVFLGTGLGYHIQPYVKNIPAKTKILLVDYYPRFIEHSEQKVFAGLPNAMTTISSATDRREDIAARISLDAQRVQIIKHPASYAANRGFYESITDALRFKRVQKKEKGSVLLFFGNFFLEEELRRALAQSDGGVSLFAYTAHGDRAAYESSLAKAIQKERPQFILSVNMKGFDGEGFVGDIAWRLGVPVVVWFVDDPHPIMLHQKPPIRKNMVALTWERTYLPWINRLGFGSSGYLPLAGDGELFSPVPAEKTVAEIGFAGSSMGQKFLHSISSRFLWNAQLGPIAAAASQLLLADRSRPLPDIIADAVRKCGVPLPFSDDKNITWLCSYIIHTASMMKRKALVEACLPVGIQTFGDPEGWKALVGDTLPVHPDIDYRTGLASVYRSIAVNINITSCQMPTAVNQRVFDAPLCGAFILNDDQPDLQELFAPDEYAVYRSKEELLEKINFFRSRETERNRIAAKARSRILAEHTYAHRTAAIRKMPF